MKTYLQSLLLFFVLSHAVNAQWFWQNPLPQGNTLSGVDFIDSSNGWLVGYYGTILKSINA